MSEHHDLPAVLPGTRMTVTTPVIPLNFVYPGLSLTQIFSIVSGYRRLSLLIILIVLSATALIMAEWPRTYTAKVTLIVSYEVSDPQSGKELPVGQAGSYIATQVELMQTPDVLLTVVDRLNLTQSNDYIKGYQSDSGTLRQWVSQKVSRNLAVYQGQHGSQLIYVNYSSKNSADAAQVANTVADVYLMSSQVRSLKSALFGQQVRMAKLNMVFGPRHPEVVDLQSQINATQRSIDLQLKGSAARASTAVVIQDDTAPVEYIFTSGGYYTNVSFISRATPPVKAIKPKILTGVLLGNVVAGVLGFGIPLAYELFNRRVRCRDDIEREHGIPVLVEFPARPLRMMS